MLNLSGRTYNDEFTNLTDEELYSLADQLLFDADHIEHQIDMRRAREEERNEHVDREWLAKATYAMKTKRRKYEAITQILKDRDEHYEHTTIRNFISQVKATIRESTPTGRTGAYNL